VTRKNTVFGVGNVLRPLVVFLGAAPGRNEEEQNLPFAGFPGQILKSLIEGVGLTLDQVYLMNTILCKPPRNRAPIYVELVGCRPALFKQLELLNPHVIVAMGRTAAGALLGDDAHSFDLDTPVRHLRGRWFTNLAWPIRVTYHPDFFRRMRKDLISAQEDFLSVRQFLEVALK
jgi:DNA polymerase